MGRKVPPTKKSSTPSNASDVSANNISTRQTATEKELLKRVANLEKVVEKLQSELYITKNVNTLLSNEIDHLQQYQGRHCIVMDGLRTSPNETSDQITEKAEKVLTENLQFDPEEETVREPVYLKRRKCNKKQKIKLSLT